MLKGVVASVLASVLFGCIYWISPFLAPLGGEEIFGWRVLATLPFTTLLLVWRGEWRQVRHIAARVRARPLLGAALLLSAAMVGVQLWLFMWAPMAGRALPVSLGYFLLPLVMVLVGRVLYRERLSGPHKLATALATAGVAAELLRAGGVSWETWLVAIGYPLYFALRRRLRTEQLGGHWVDMALAVPVATWFVLRAPSTLPVVAGDGALAALVLLVGVLSAVALALYMAASGLLPMGLFGLLTYVEPVLLALVAWLLGERLAPGQWLLYGLVFAAVAVLVADGLRTLLRAQARLKF
ncbi:MAG: chemotaxis protein [Acidovorax sp. SCN 68-22]|nr:MAG: chemotaxis protein [Acidovorax sp. SCN 68-22]